MSDRKLADAAEFLWGVVANVSGGGWGKQSKEWQEAATMARDRYFAASGMRRRAVPKLAVKYAPREHILPYTPHPAPTGVLCACGHDEMDHGHNRVEDPLHCVVCLCPDFVEGKR